MTTLAPQSLIDTPIPASNKVHVLSDSPLRLPSLWRDRLQKTGPEVRQMASTLKEYALPVG